MPVRPTYASFLVRLWREAEPNPQELDVDWQGEVQHIQTSQRRDFGTLDVLLRLLRQATEDADVPN